MNETFQFGRFWTYFKYDLKQMWRNHSTSAILIGGSVALFYILWVLFSLVFTQHWTSPVLVARLVVLLIAFFILELYQAHTYGHLTDKKAGAAWLMVPASRLEKYLSMLLITLIVIPALFFVVFLLLDGFLSLVDPTYGQALFTGFTGAIDGARTFLSTLGSEIPVSMTPGTLTFLTIVSIFCNFLYFLLCGICFKKNKIVMAIAILFAFSVVSSILSGILLPLLGGDLVEMVSSSEETAIRFFIGVMNASIILECLTTLALGWGVWHRVKTLQH